MFKTWHIRTKHGVIAAVCAAALCLSAALFSTQAAGAEGPAQEGVEVPIIMYHGILKDPKRAGPYVITPDTFEGDLRYLQEHGYTTVVMQDLIDYVDEGRPLPKKPILLTFDDTVTAAQAQELSNQIAELNAETDFDQITALQEQLDALYTDLDAEAEAIIEQINSGADFETLMAQYNEDSGANYEPVRTQGYYDSANTTQYAPDFVEASMMLEQPGQVSTPIHTVDGVHIILYVADVTPGEVSLEDAREAVTEDVLEEKRQTYYDEQVAQWVADANPQYYPDRMQ